MATTPNFCHHFVYMPNGRGLKKYGGHNTGGDRTSLQQQNMPKEGTIPQMKMIRTVTYISLSSPFPISNDSAIVMHACMIAANIITQFL